MLRGWLCAVLRKGTQALTHTPASAALSRLSARGLVSLVAADEAHCVVDWGSSFRAAYRSQHRGYVAL